MGETNKEFGKRLKSLLKGEGLTQVAFAVEMDVSQPTVGYWCSGRVPELDTLTRIAGYFGVTVDYLLTGRSPWEQGVVVDGRRVREDDDRARLLRKYNDVDEATRRAIKAILDAATETVEQKKKPPGIEEPKRKRARGE